MEKESRDANRLQRNRFRPPARLRVSVFYQQKQIYKLKSLACVTPVYITRTLRTRLVHLKYNINSLLIHYQHYRGRQQRSKPKWRTPLTDYYCRSRPLFTTFFKDHPVTIGQCFPFTALGQLSVSLLLLLTLYRVRSAVRNLFFLQYP